MILKSRYEIYQGLDQLYHWRQRAANGRQVSDGSESYSTKQGAERGIFTSIYSACGIRPNWEAGAKYGHRYSMRWLRVAAATVCVRTYHPKAAA